MNQQAMRVVQTTAWFPPYHLGGTEVYVAGLVAGLRARGVESVVLTPRHPIAPDTYEHEGTRVETYPVNETPLSRELRDNLLHQDFERFQKRIQGYAGAIYHQHSWTRGCGHHHLKAARAMGMATVLTIHLPETICMRGTMMRFGETACDGRIDELVCGACYLTSRGLPKGVARSCAATPRAIAARLHKLDCRISTLLTSRFIAGEKCNQLRILFENADRVVVVCRWLFDALISNGADRGRLVLSRQGLPSELAVAMQAASAGSASDRSEALRLLYVGRWDQRKGVDVLVRSVRALPAVAAVRLTIHANSADAEGRGYEASVRKIAGDDPRISFAGPVARNELPGVMARHDALAVPSLCLETGPIVVLEAQAAGAIADSW